MNAGAPPEEFVRPAAPDDLPELVRLEADHRSAIAATPRGGLEWLREHAVLGTQGWTQALEDNTCQTLVAGLDDVTLGYASMRLNSTSLTAVISTVYVDPGARELGLGDSLLAGLLAAARDAGMQAVESSALPGDRDTKNLFERAGLVARLIIVSQRLV